MIDFSSLLAALDDAGVEFIVVGGVAATIHGSARLTLDLDIVYRRTPENLTRVIHSLAPYAPYLRGAPSGLPFRWDVETLQRGVNFTWSEVRSKSVEILLQHERGVASTHDRFWSPDAIRAFLVGRI